jgi:cathepsin A (carboxypeptidase C)
MGGMDDETNTPCTWCKCAAIPSECLSQEQAKLAPPGVFDCSIPGSVHGDDEEEEDSTRRYTFGGTEYVYELSEAAVDGEFCDPSSKSLSGYMDIKGSKYDENGENKHLFYWMFEKRPTRNEEELKDEETPFVVWLTGGPGCSSSLALLSENGPCSVNDDGKSTSINPYSWTEAAHVLWLDQPAGVGYSYGAESDTSEEMISEDAYYFLQAFFKSHPEYVNAPLFIIGESYGGHYAPAIAHRVYRGNNEAKTGTIPLNLAGVGIGNGLTKPEEQYQWYPEMVYNNSHGIKVVSEQTYETMKAVVPKCAALIHECNQGDSTLNTLACQSAFVVCNMGLTSPYQMTGLNPYDIRKKCEVPPLCYDMSHIASFMNSETTKEALHVDSSHSHNWQTCNMGINLRFHTDWMKDFSGYVAELLNAGIPALIYAGDVDFICNYLGNKAWTLGLEWDGGDDFRAAEEHDWMGQGLARSAKGLTFLQVYDAGHMVPSDQPENALTMLKIFLSGGKF